MAFILALQVFQSNVEYLYYIRLVFYYLNYFRITETVKDMRAFTLLTDDVLQIIMNKAESKKLKQAKGSNEDSSSGLFRARDILLDIMNRRFYKCVFEARCKVY